MPRGPRRNLRPGGGEERATDRADVDRELADRLAGVEQVGDSGTRDRGSDAGGRVDETTRGRHVRDRDEPHPFVEHARERGDVELAGGGARDDLDHRAGAPRDLQHRDEVARVLGPVREDAVAGPNGIA